jgi:LmbE family N-acetylglucosaminyl deacetylase
MNLEKKKILVVAAHPDDDILGCGGTLAKAVSLKAKVKIIFLGEGVSSRFDSGEENTVRSKKANEIRTRECIESLKVIGIKNHIFENRLCTRFDELPLLNLVKSIEREIKSFRPNVIFTHNRSEVNIDHKLTYDAVEVACRPINKKFLKQVYSFEIVCSGNWKFEKNFSPTTYVDITKFFKKKLISWSKYKNENNKFPHPRSKLGIETLARYRGMQSDNLFAEAFMLEREIID